MMDCKKALEENGGEVEAAKQWLRKRASLQVQSAMIVKTHKVQFQSSLRQLVLQSSN